MPTTEGWIQGGVEVAGDGTGGAGRYAWFNPLSELCMELGKDDPIYIWWYNAVGTQATSEVVPLDSWNLSTIQIPTICDGCIQRLGLYTVFYQIMFANFLGRQGVEFTPELLGTCPPPGA
jgi:hypothetical protein